MSAVFGCRMADGRGAVLKASPDRDRLASEAAALDAWPSVHTPAVIALDERPGALLLELIEPGTPLAVSSAYPAAERVAERGRRLATRLAQDDARTVLLHGDLTPSTLLDGGAERLLGWCMTFAAMVALELASQGTGPGARIDALLELASRA